MASVSKREWEYKGQRKEAWIVRYVDGKGVHRQKTFPLKKPADAYKRKVEAEIADGTHIAIREAETIEQLSEAFLRSEEDRLRDKIIGQTHYDWMRNIIDRSVIRLIGKRLANDLQSLDVENWYQAMRRQDGLKADVAKERVKLLGRIYVFGFRRRIVRHNPVPEAMVQLRGIVRSSIRTFAREQVMAILVAADQRDRWQREPAFNMTRCAVHLAACCGLRWGEIMGLRVDNLDFANRVIEVRHSLTKHDLLKGPKTKSGLRDVPMPEHLAELLSAWMRTYYLENDRRLLFRTPEGRIILPGSFHRSYWGRVLKRAGLHGESDNFHFHALRHFASSWMIANNIPIMDVAGLLGHKKFDVTLQVYAHSIIGGQRRSELFDKMAKGLTGDIGGTAIAPPKKVENAQVLRNID